MKMFDAQLQRLKDCLHVSEDQEVARVLGMTKAALSYRKRTGNFPEEKLVSLKAKYPQLDIPFVLYGEHWNAASATQLEQYMKGAAELGTTPALLSSAILTKMPPQVRLIYEALDNQAVRSLIETLLWCDDDAIDLMQRVAARLRGPRAMPFASRPSPPTYIEPAQRGTNRKAAKSSAEK